MSDPTADEIDLLVDTDPIELRNVAWRLLKEVQRLRGVNVEGMPTQAQTLDWVRSRWPDQTDPIWRAAKLGEEAGEALGAVIKISEGRKTLLDLRMETAQVVICAMALAESAGFDLWPAVASEYERATPPLAAGGVS